MEVVTLNSEHVRTGAFGARLRLLRIAFQDGRTRDYADIPYALFAAFVKSGDPDAFLRERVADRYSAPGEAIGRLHLKY